ncbi:MAG: hypothetical protein HDT28_05705 [Clostridiales bacterium]|nr:hypothetical protein [Clostridiales bacterium]
MQYQIQTAPIWDAYKTTDGCPLCKLRKEREARLVGQYLAENVMDPDFRVRSNAHGFCAEHIAMMYKGQNKLGLALQLETRAAYLNGLLKKQPTDKKSAKKLADNIKSHCGCVICDAIDEPMQRYYMTVAQMYANEKEFPELFAEAHHCVGHAAELFEAAVHAGKSVAAFCAVLTAGLSRDLKRTEQSLRAFADCFDFKAGARPDPETIPNAIKLINAIKVN